MLIKIVSFWSSLKTLERSEVQDFLRTAHSTPFGWPDGRNLFHSLIFQYEKVINTLQKDTNIGKPSPTLTFCRGL